MRANLALSLNWAHKFDTLRKLSTQIRQNSKLVQCSNLAECQIWSLLKFGRVPNLYSALWNIGYQNRGKCGSTIWNFWFIFIKYTTIYLENHLCFMYKDLLRTPRQLNKSCNAIIVSKVFMILHENPIFWNQNFCLWKWF